MSIAERGLRVVLGCAGWCVLVMPSWLRGGIAWGLGLLLRAVRARGRIIEGNLQRAFPGVELAAERERLYRAAYTHLGHVALEAMMLFAPRQGFRRWVERNVVVRGAENFHATLKQGRGLLILSSHVGNWEVMAAISGPVLRTAITLVTKRVKPEAFHRELERARATCGVFGAYEPRTARGIFGALGRGQMVGFVADQYAGEPLGVRVPFFGVPVGTSSAPATFARRSGVPIHEAVNYRLADGRFCVELGPPIAWITADTPEEEIAVNTAEYSRRIEAQVRRHPEQWLWSHRRFKGDLSPLKPDEWKQGRARRKLDIGSEPS